MKGLYSAFGLLFLVCVQGTWQVPLQASQDNYSALIEDDLFAEPVETANVKRHSQGTFTSDFSQYQEMKRAQDLVQWLMNAKRSGSLSRRHAEGTYTSDVSSFLQNQAAKEFISWLKSAKARGE